MNIQKVKELTADIKYYIGNPSAWEYYDDSVSEKIRELVDSIEALAELEKPVDGDAIDTVEQIYISFGDNYRDEATEVLNQYAESYHAKKCTECVGQLPAFPHRKQYYPLGQEPISQQMPVLWT